jgi:hypothetical protein
MFLNTDFGIFAYISISISPEYRWNIQGWDQKSKEELICVPYPPYTYNLKVIL